MSEFRMPSLGADMQEGTLIEWSVKPGDSVKRGDIIGVIRTEKADIEVEVWEDGVIDQLLAKPGDTLPVGAVLAVIRGLEMPVGKPPIPEEKAVARTERIKISPLARRIAKELGVDLARVHGTGPQGAITREDIEKAAHAPAPAVVKPPAVKPGVAYEGMRHAIAMAMARSNREIPHYYLETRIDMDRALKFLAAENQKRPVQERLLHVVLLIKAVALALKEIPELNAYWIADRLEPKESIHIGFAISLRQGGLVVPAIHDADRKTLNEMMGALRDLITRARAGRLRGSEITDGTVTITNLGDLGVETVHGVIYPPQVALIGFGRVVESPWAENGMLGIRPVLTATLAGDHRATDGHRGAQFLTALNRLLQQPEKL
jgi:pyruvate dehydrogenase E2 component (dihydrolipoamide acetyltransferase)